MMGNSSNTRHACLKRSGHWEREARIDSVAKRMLFELGLSQIRDLLWDGLKGTRGTPKKLGLLEKPSKWLGLGQPHVHTCLGNLLLYSLRLVLLPPTPAKIWLFEAKFAQPNSI